MIALEALLADLEVRVVESDPRRARLVRWVHISELADPTPWLSGGELLLTTGMALDTPEQQRAYVARLAAHGAAGLGLGTGLGHDEVPRALREAAREVGLPLVEIPYDVPFIAITEKAAAHLAAERTAGLQHALAAHERLERIVLSGGGLDGLAAALAEEVGGAAAVLDARGEPLAGAAPALAAAVRERVAGGGGGEFAPAGGLALPIAGPASPPAWLVAGRDGGALSALQRLVLHGAVTVVALELLRARVAQDTERRLAGDVLTAMLAGELGGAELARRLAPFGLGERVGVVVLAPPRAARVQAEDALAAAVREEARGGLVGATHRFVAALVAPPRGLDAEAEQFGLAERLRARVAQALGTRLPAGAGRPTSTAELRRGFHEARCALEARELGGAAGGDGNGNGRGATLLATYRDLGSFQLLLALQDDDALRVFCDSILAPIEAGEGAYGGELTRSLEVFIECNGQWERAARQLLCHRHTLRYRIRRVEELTGRSLDTARDRIDFWLALRGRELMTSTRGG